MRYYLIIPILAGALLLVLYFVSCQEKSFELNDSHKQNGVLDRDQSSVPVPDTVVIIDSNNVHVMIIIELTKNGDYILRKRRLQNPMSQYITDRLLIDNITYNTIGTSKISFAEDTWFVPIDDLEPEVLISTGEELQCFCEVEETEFLGNPCEGMGSCEVWIRVWSKNPCDWNECCAKCDARLCVNTRTILDPRGLVLSEMV